VFRGFPAVARKNRKSRSLEAAPLLVDFKADGSAGIHLGPFLLSSRTPLMEDYSLAREKKFERRGELRKERER